MSTAKNPGAENSEENITTTTDEDNVQGTGLPDQVSSPDVDDVDIDFSDGVVYEEDYPDDLVGFPDEPPIDPPDDVEDVYEAQQLAEAEAAEEQAQAAVELSLIHI